MTQQFQNMHFVNPRQCFQRVKRYAEICTKMTFTLRSKAIEVEQQHHDPYFDPLEPHLIKDLKIIVY